MHDDTFLHPSAVPTQYLFRVRLGFVNKMYGNYFWKHLKGSNASTKCKLGKHNILQMHFSKCGALPKILFRTFKFIKCFRKGEQLFQLNVLPFCLNFSFSQDRWFILHWAQYLNHILVSCCMKSTQLKLGWRKYVHRACTSLNREYSMIFRGPGFLAPLSREQVSLSQSSYASPVGLTDGRVGGGPGEEPNRMTARKPGPLSINQYSLILTLFRSNLGDLNVFALIFCLHYSAVWYNFLGPASEFQGSFFDLCIAMQVLKGSYWRSKILLTLHSAHCPAPTNPTGKNWPMRLSLRWKKLSPRTQPNPGSHYFMCSRNPQ